MMSMLSQLYQEVIIDHNRNPRNFGRMENPDRTAEGYNPLCGDQLVLYLRFDPEGRIGAVAFDGSGCAISVASASLMTEYMKGRTMEEAERLFECFQGMVTDVEHQAEPSVELGKLAVLAGVREFPSRVKCATLSWHTLRAALHGDGQEVSTETESAEDEQYAAEP
jgi:nitrogen fixation NifU-like protein